MRTYNKPKQKRRRVQLPAHFRPERYVLTLEPAIEAATFSGEEVLHYTLTKPVKKITLHAAELAVSGCCRRCAYFRSMLHTAKKRRP